MDKYWKISWNSIQKFVIRPNKRNDGSIITKEQDEDGTPSHNVIEPWMTYITSDIGHHTMSIFLIYDAHSIDSATKRLFSTVPIVKLWSHIFSITPHLLYHWNYEFQYRISFIFVFIFLIFDVDLQLIPLRVFFINIQIDWF